MNKERYPEYTVDYISGCMSLRKPQKTSLKILDNILNEIELTKTPDLQSNLEIVHDTYNICSSFERDFMSLTFALATGVGKTRLMGAFITYLYTNKNIKNFFVVAPNLTIYQKLIDDLGNVGNPKYVFKGIGCFSGAHPNIITGEDYKEKQLYYNGIGSNINIYIFNIDKFNSEQSSMRSLHELVGESFFEYLSKLDDLVLIMDESHHYRAKAGFNAINELKPVLGLELTATPQVQEGSKTVKFKNVVYDYPLGRAIADGYTRTPFALTRRDINILQFDDDDKDKMMITDGLKHHERMKNALEKYANDNQLKKIKPFVLIVCKDTGHAEKVLEYIESEECMNGKYKEKVIEIHSNQKGAEKSENIAKLLNVEKSDNPIEIVIHVNILKEGWDVNNLYTIIPLRTATSKTLREQTVGRGLRLPYGERTGNEEVDSVVITAHDRFQEIIEEARSTNSIFNVKNVIFAEENEQMEIVYSQAKMNLSPVVTCGEFLERKEYYSVEKNEKTEEKLKSIEEKIDEAIESEALNYTNSNLTTEQMKEKTIQKLKDDNKDLAQIYKEANDMNELLKDWINVKSEEKLKNVSTNVIPIPQIKIIENGESNYTFLDFDLDLSEFNYAPITNELELRNLLNPNDSQVLSDDRLNFKVVDPRKTLIEELISKPEIDYDRCNKLLFKLIVQCLSFLAQSYGDEDIKNIVMFNKKEIGNKIYNQMLKHFDATDKNIIEEIYGVSTQILDNTYVNKKDKIKNLYDPIEEGEKITSIVYEGFSDKALHIKYKFDSNPERIFAQVCEHDSKVIKWMRPAPKQFNLTYNNGSKYEPDFVVETDDAYYLIEIKAENQLDDADVLAKKEKAIIYCELATVYNAVRNLKPWKHLFIPSQQIQSNSSFQNLAQRFEAKKCNATGIQRHESAEIVKRSKGKN